MTTGSPNLGGALDLIIAATYDDPQAKALAEELRRSGAQAVITSDVGAYASYGAPIVVVLAPLTVTTPAVVSAVSTQSPCLIPVLTEPMPLPPGPWASSPITLSASLTEAAQAVMQIARDCVMLPQATVGRTIPAKIAPPRHMSSESAPPPGGLGLAALAISGFASLPLFFIAPLVRIPGATGQSSEPIWVTGVQSVTYTLGPGALLWIVPLTGLMALAVSLLYGPVFYALGKKVLRRWIAFSVGVILCIAGAVSEFASFSLFAAALSDSSAFTTVPSVQASAESRMFPFTIFFLLSAVAPFLVGVWGQSQVRRATALEGAVSEVEAARIDAGGSQGKAKARA